MEVGGFAPPSEHLFLSGTTSLVLLSNRRLSARRHGGGLVRMAYTKADEPRLLGGIPWFDGVPFAHGRHKRRRGLSVSPGNLIVVAYFFGPILAGLANRHLLPGGNRYPSNLLHPRNTEIVKDLLTKWYYIVSFSYNNFCVFGQLILCIPLPNLPFI